MAGANSHGTTNSTTDVDVVASPAASTTRLIPAGGFNIYNNDTVAATVTLQFNKTATDIVLEVAELQSGESWSNPMPLVLDATDEKLQVYLGGAVTANQLDWFSHYRDEAQ